MGILRTTIQPILAVIVATVGFSLPVAAASQAELLDSLKSATPEEAVRIDRQLQAEWSRSGSASMDLLLRRGREALEEQDIEAAIEHFTALTDHAPDFAEGWFGLARSYFEADLYGPSLDALGRTLALNPNHYNALFGLGVMFQNFGDYRRAEEAFSRVLDLNPNHTEAKEALEGLQRVGVGRSL